MCTYIDDKKVAIYEHVYFKSKTNLTHVYFCDKMQERGGKMAYTQAQGRASNKYAAKAYDRIALQVKKGKRDIIKAHAESKGMSLNAYINDLIEKDMKENEK